MKLIKAQSTNLRNIRGGGVKYGTDGRVTMDSDNSLIVPKGPTSTRPINASPGDMRYNTDTLKFEFFEHGEWINSIDTADNVYYVSQNGSDNYNGKTIGSAFSSIGHALSVIPDNSTLKVLAGDYTLNNPVIVPRNVGIIGDSLRTVTVRAGNPTQDMFWVNNGSYLQGMTFKDHEAPSSAVAFNPDGSAGEIFQSPYVQNCTSITTTGTGMRVDGRHAQGLKSMVVDAFTQYNQGGIGIHMLYLGNTQLVSVFTICCDIAILCEEGGFCSLTNSNSSFGVIGLKSTGVSQPKYTGTVAQSIVDPTFGGDTILINNLVNRPNSGDAVKFSTLDDYYTISTASDVKVGKTRIDSPDFSSQLGALTTAKRTVLDDKAVIRVNTIAYINTTFPDLKYDQAKCSRDVGIIIDAVLDDMVLNTNYKSVIAGKSYYQNAAVEVINNQKTETLAAIGYAKTEVLALLTPATDAYIRVADNFDEITDIITNGIVNADPIVFNTPVGATSAQVRAKDIILANADFIEEEAVSYIELNYPDLTYDEAACRRDVAFILDGIIYDILYQGNSQSIVVGEQYYSGGTLQLGAGEKQATINTYKYMRQVTRNCLLNISVVRLNTTVTQDNGTTSATVAEADKSDLLFNIISSYIESGGYINDFVETTAPNEATQEQDAIDLRDIIVANKSKIAVDTIEYLNEKYSDFNYNEEKCSRDVGLILDAVAMDMALGTNYNSVIAGLSYQRINTIKVRNDQKVQTKSAIEFVRDTILALNIGTTATTRVTDAFTEILAIFDGNAASALVFTDPDDVTQDNLKAKLLLQANRDFLMAETIAFINNRYPPFVYDEDKCSRDVGLILDAVALDMVLDTNYNTNVAAMSYYRAAASDVIDSQLPQTLLAIDFIKTQILKLDISSVATNRLSLLFTKLRSTIETGTPASINNNDPINATATRINSRLQLEFNKTFIQDEIDAWIAVQVAGNIAPFTSGFTYDSAACRRDVGYIVEAVIFDVLYGGNVASRIAAESYFVGAVGQLGVGESEETIAAYNRLQEIIEQIIQEQTVSVSAGNSSAQNLDANAGGVLEATQASDSIQVIIDVITAGSLTGLAARELPLITWASSTLQSDYANIVSNKNSIAEDTIFEINNSIADFAYDEDACARDVGFIVDALTYDQLYGGNSAIRTVALSYYTGTQSQLGSDERIETIAAYNHLSDVISNVVQEISVTATVGNVESQVINGNPTIEETANQLAIKLGYVTNVLIQASTSVIVNKVNPGLAWIDTELQSDYLEIVTNRLDVRESAIAYINNRFKRFQYDQTKCSRDVEIIMQAVADDMLFQTNYKTVLAGRSYYRASASEVVGNQLSETVAALEFVKTETLELIASDSSTNQPEYATVSNLFDTLIDIVLNGESAAPLIDYTSPIVSNDFKVRASSNLQDNRDFIIAEGTAYITAYYPLLGYDRATCERDIGLIVDALGYDLMFGSNFRSITAGRSYYRQGAAVVTDSQKAATLGTFAYLKTLVSDLTQGSMTAQASVESNMDIIIDILDNGLGVVPSFVTPAPASGTGNANDIGYANARDLIESNRAFIKAEVVQYITNSYPALIYNQATCERDVDYILDAMYYDLTYGGNMETLVAANAYYSFTTLQIPTGEKAATLATYAFMRDLIGDISQSVDVAELQVVVAQVAGVAGSGAAELAAEGLVDDIITTIDTGTAPAEVAASNSWVASALVTEYNRLQTNKSTIQTDATAFIEENYAYKVDTCERDIGFIVDAVSYDMLYDGNSQTIDAADEYYSGGTLQIPETERGVTIATYTYLKSVAANVVLEIEMNPLQTVEPQVIVGAATTDEETDKLKDLFDVIIRLIDRGYICEVTLDETIASTDEITINEVIAGSQITFHQYSLIVASGHTFEWVGAGINVNSALPYEGGRPILENQVVQEQGGKIYYTGTDQEGDFRIGNDLTINRTTGTIEGDTFDRSLFAVLTPYILAIED